MGFPGYCNFGIVWNTIPGKTTYENRGCESWELDCLALRRNRMDSDWQGMFVHGLGLLARTCCRGTRRVSWELTSGGHQSLFREMEHTLLPKSASVRVVFVPGIIFLKNVQKGNRWMAQKSTSDLGKTWASLSLPFFFLFKSSLPLDFSSWKTT